MNLPKKMWAWRYASSTKPSAPPLRLARGAWDDRRSEVFVSDVEYIRADIHEAEVARLRGALKTVTDIAYRQEIEALYPDDLRGLAACIDDMVTTARAALGDADA